MSTVYEAQLKAQQHYAGPIQSEAALPAPGTGRESQTLDFKVALAQSKDTGKPKLTELAKDMAALANARGGTILVGAAEKDEILTKYMPLSDREAKTAICAYENAASQYCSPTPVITCMLIPHGSGFVVSIYVQPHPGNLMGVRIPVEKHDLYAGGTAFRFPMRVGSQTAEVQPASFPVPEARKIMLALAQIPPGAQVQLFYRTDNPGGIFDPIHDFRALNIDQQFFETAPKSGAARPTPVDDVRVVIPPAEGTTQHWQVRMKDEARW